MSSGISIQRLAADFLLDQRLGENRLRSAGPTGCFVAGWIGGGICPGKSAWILYHAWGISLSDSRIRFELIKISCHDTAVALPCRLPAWAGRGDGTSLKKNVYPRTTGTIPLPPAGEGVL